MVAPRECYEPENKRKCTEPEMERISDDLMELNDTELNNIIFLMKRIQTTLLTIRMETLYCKAHFIGKLVLF